MQNLDSNLSKNSEVGIASLIMEVIPLAMREIRVHSRAHRGPQLKLAQFRVLAHIWRQSKTNSQLADEIGLSVAAMSRLVSGLVNKGLVTRNENPNDRRECYVQISREGAQLFKSIRQTTCETIAHKITGLTAKEKSELQKGLQLIAKALFEVST
ncbi:MAG: MarR family winged helix-turn-helix transcriptional regulator [Pseudobdellovibrionaceae bacterium]